MARTLKTYVTSLGFFDLAVAAPSMKAALEAWGAGSNLFHQGFAKETDDPAIVTATLAKPGVVLRRPVRSDGAFKEQAELPKSFPHEARAARPKTSGKREPPAKPARPMDEQAARKAAVAFEKEQKRRDAERRKEDAAREKIRRRREQATAKAQAALQDARQAHEKRTAEIDRERAALDRRAAQEDARWEKQRKTLEADLRRARE